MNSKEVAEIRKLFTLAECALMKIVGWWIDAEKECVYEMDRKFLNLPEEIILKFFHIFKKGLSGKVKKNIYDLEFTENKAGKSRLYKLLGTKLMEEEDWRIFIENIVENYEHVGRYAVFLVHGAYDIPGKASDDTEMFDASDSVYEYIMTCICPVALQGPGISFNEEGIKEAERQWIVLEPETAFVYPAFNDRTSDYDHVWFYTKKSNEPDEGLVEQVLGCRMPVTPAMQKEAFLNMTKSDTFSKYEMEQLKEIYHDIQSLAIEGEIGKPITRKQIESILGVAGTGTDEEVVLQNIINLKKFNVQMADASIVVAADRTDLIEERSIEGEEYILVKKNGSISVNGIVIGKENGQDSK